MGIAIFLTCLLLLYVGYDLTLRARLLLSPRRRLAIMSEFQHVAARGTLSLARAYCGFRVRVSAFRGETPRQCLVISNHQSLADIPVLMYALASLDVRFVAKRELGRHIPGVSLVLRKAEHALIGRTSGYVATRRALLALGALARRGVSPVVFPEGTRSRTGEVGRFHAAAVRILADATRLPILSVALDGGYGISRLEGVARKLPGTRYRVAPLTLYPAPNTRGDLQAILEAARAEIRRQLVSWRDAEAASGRAEGS